MSTHRVGVAGALTVVEEDSLTARRIAPESKPSMRLSRTGSSSERCFGKDCHKSSSSRVSRRTLCCPPSSGFALRQRLEVPCLNIGRWRVSCKQKVLEWFWDLPLGFATGDAYDRDDPEVALDLAAARSFRRSARLRSSLSSSTFSRKPMR